MKSDTTIEQLTAENHRLRKIVGSTIRSLAVYVERDLRTEPGPLSGPTWAKVGHICCLGSTSAIALCREFDADPEAIAK